MADSSEALASAIEHHHAGRMQAAEQIYRQILRAEPNHAEAMFFLGVMALQLGKNEPAVELMSNAVRLNGRVPGFHYHLARAHAASQRLTDATACYRRAIDLDPNFFDAHNNLGNLLVKQEELDEAVACYRAALALKPDFAEGYSNLGVALRAQGKLAEAAASLSRAIELKPDYAEAYNNLGNTLLDQGKIDQAVASYRQSLKLKSDYADGLNNLGNALVEQRRLDEAIRCFQRALDLKPDFAPAHLNLGNALMKQDAPHEAAACYRRALALSPALTVAQNNLGNAQMAEGNPEAAISSFRRAVELKPDYSEAHCNLGISLLLTGRYEEGWREYEHRLDFSSTPRKLSKPRWDGEPAEGKTILIHHEQGFGDTIQFIRYLPFVRRRAGQGRLILEVQPGLARLLTQNGGWHAEIVASAGLDESGLPPFDYQVPLMSLPLALGLFEPLPMKGEYVRATLELRDRWRARMGARTGCRVGLVWAGSPKHKADRTRSMRGESLLPLLRMPGFQFYSLQVGLQDRPDDLQEGTSLIDLTAEIADFADTAALLAELDLIVSVDTAVAHLAGAMGRPVWTLLAFQRDWRWGPSGETTPWYPTMRLFRQPSAGDWDSVVQSVARELAGFVVPPTAKR